MTRPLGSTDLKRLHREWRRRASGRLALVLDSVATPANVGSILRTAAALKVEDVWLCARTPAVTHPGVGRTALGSERYLSVHHEESTLHALDRARAAGYVPVAIELVEAAVPLHEADLSGAVALVVGHEDRGVSPAVLDAVDSSAFVPQLGRIGSLNVAAAASIALYEARRQGWPPAPEKT